MIRIVDNCPEESNEGSTGDQFAQPTRRSQNPLCSNFGYVREFSGFSRAYTDTHAEGTMSEANCCMVENVCNRIISGSSLLLASIPPMQISVIKLKGSDLLCVRLGERFPSWGRENSVN